MNDPLDNDFLELGWRQQLTQTEQAELQAHLAAHPEAKADWEADRQLNQLLEKLPAAPPVASNFTALVMQAVEREKTAQKRTPIAGWRSWLAVRNWLPRTAVACLIVGFSIFAFNQHQVKARELMARRVATLAEAVSASGLVGDESPQADTKLSELMASSMQ